MVATPLQIDDLQVDDLQGKVTQRVVLENVSWQTYRSLFVFQAEVNRSSSLDCIAA